MSDATALRLAPDVAAAARGDHRAFARLVDATRSTVTSITLAILRDVEASRDVAQDVYLQVWRDLKKLRDPTSFLPWLRQVTRNRAHQALRSGVRRRRRLEADGDLLLAAVDDSTPRFLRISGDRQSTRGLARATSDATGTDFRLLRAGGLGRLRVLIRITRTLVPRRRDVFPPWQGMQYLYDMFSGLALLDPLDNDRYPAERWTTVREVVAAR